jgi:hypothetical protein
MRKFNLSLCLAILCLVVNSQESNFWTRVSETQITKNLFSNRYKPDAYQLFQLNESSLVQQMRNAPSERSISSSASGFIITVPVAEGQLQHFRVVDAPVMDPSLAARYPEIKSYAGTSVEDPSSTIRFDISPRGFHGMILGAGKPTIYIDPVDRTDKFYVVFERKDVLKFQREFRCLTPASINEPTLPVDPTAFRAADDGRLRTYRLALACTGEYAQFFLDGTETTDAERKAKVLAAMNTLMVRTDGIYERDFGIRMNLIANNDAIIYLNPSTDPWSTEWNIKTQQTIDAVIGNANYDIGHLVHKEASAANNNGSAGCIACVCKTWNGSTNPNTFVGKGGGFTSHVTPEGDPFVVDYTTHEMGHQFGANHTFTFSTETGTASQFEPGSGSTIMGYAGITGATDVQPHSDDYFHARSVEQISDYIKSGTGGGACAVVTITGNTAPVVNAGTDFTIPKSTPFTLTGSASDGDAGDVLTYTWEQMNAGTSSTTNPSTTATTGPLFRSRTGSTSTSRTFPILSSILDGTNGNQWERLPGVARTLNFRLVVRDNHAGGGNTKDDDMAVTISSAAGPFAVTSPNTAVNWGGGSSQTITWNVNGTNASPVSCANVKISLSTDGGLSFPTVLTASTSNDGTEVLTIPNSPTSTARIKVEAVGNIFFDISNTNFTIGTVTGCNAPAGLTSNSVTNNSATVSWTAVSGAISYDVDYKINASSTWTNAVTGTASTSQPLPSLTASTLYDWRVRTNCSSGSSAYSTAQFTTLANPSGCLNAFEPNGTLATAAAAVVNSPISAAIGSNGDIDYYTFTTSSTSNFNITLTNLPGDYDLFLYNSAGTQLASSEAGGTTSEAIVSNSRPAGTYYVRVIGFNGAFSTTVCYNLNIGVTTATGCASPLDNSTNGTLAGAATIPFNTNTTGLISPSGDVDNYQFTITTGGTISLTLTTLPGDYDLKLLNSSGTQIGISQAGGTSSESINATVAAGTYYAQVYGFNGANSATVCYTLRVGLGTASRGAQDLITGTTRKINLAPNPVTQTLKINLAGFDAKSELIMTDVNGRVVIRKQIGNSSMLDMSSFSSGIYLVNITNGGKIVESRKIVKQ